MNVIVDGKAQKLRVNPKHSSNNSSSSLPSLGSPSRFKHVAVNPAFFLTALPADLLFHTAGFLNAMDLVLLGRTCKSLYSISGDIQRSVPGEHWGGGFNRRVVEQRELTKEMLCWLQERREQRAQAVQTVTPPGPMTPANAGVVESTTSSFSRRMVEQRQLTKQTLSWLQERREQRVLAMQTVTPPGPTTPANTSVVASTASSIGSRFRHICFEMNGGPLVPEIGEALVKADGWQHLELRVSDIRPLPLFLQQLLSTQMAKRSASATSGVQPDRQLSIHFVSIASLMSRTDATLDAIMALQAAACGIRIVSLLFPKEPTHFLPVIEANPHIEKFTAQFDWDAAPLLDALRTSSTALKSLSLQFNQVNSEQPDFGSFFDDACAWQLERLSIHARCMAASRISLDFIESCKIRDIRLHGVEFDSNRGAESAFGAAIAANTTIESLELKYCRFLGSSFDRLLSGLQSSTTLKCLMLHHNIRFDRPIASIQLVDSVKVMKALSEVHFDKGFYSMNGRKIRELQVVRPDLRIFVDKELISFGADLDWGERESGCQSDSDESTGSYHDSADSDPSMDDGENDSSNEDQSQDDVMADIGRVINRAKSAEKQ
jgi:hypothetical protein